MVEWNKGRQGASVGFYCKNTACVAGIFCPGQHYTLLGECKGRSEQQAGPEGWGQARDGRCRAQGRLGPVQL